MSKGISDDVFTMLAATDKKYGLPAGTMHAIMQQETGGNEKYINDPTAYHYGLNAEGKRIAGHTGKVSTAFGPFGILESTAADPGFGITPLKDKTSLADQMDFAGAYVSKRGVAAYGEGENYRKQVAARMGNAPVAMASPVSPTQVAEAPLQAAAPQVQAAPVQVAQAQTQKPVNESDLVDPNMAWNGVPTTIQESVPTAAVAFGPKFAAQAPMIQPNFAAFSGWGKRRA